MKKSDYIQYLSEQIGFNLMDYIDDLDEVNDFQDILDQLEQHGAFPAEGEVIYYNDAMHYLSENDPSLTDSMELASEFGYATKDINSELLATLHKTEKLRNDFFELEDEFEPDDR